MQNGMSALPPNVLQNYFEGVARAILIQDQTKMSNVDSPHRSIGFDYCAIAMRQRVLQHIPPKSGHWLAAVLALRGHFGNGDVTDVAQLALGGWSTSQPRKSFQLFKLG